VGKINGKVFAVAEQLAKNALLSCLLRHTSSSFSEVVIFLKIYLTMSKQTHIRKNKPIEPKIKNWVVYSPGSEANVTNGVEAHLDVDFAGFKKPPSSITL